MRSQDSPRQKWAVLYGASLGRQVLPGRAPHSDKHHAEGIAALQAGTEGITQTIRAMVLTAVVQDGHAAQGLEV